MKESKNQRIGDGKMNLQVNSRQAADLKGEEAAWEKKKRGRQKEISPPFVYTSAKQSFYSSLYVLYPARLTEIPKKYDSWSKTEILAGRIYPNQ